MLIVNWKEFLYMPRNDRNTILALLLLALIAIVLIFFIGGQQTETPLTAADSIVWEQFPPPATKYKGKKNYQYAVEGRQAELFPFDPNTADSTQLLRLGLHPWQVRNIYKYRAKGGIYRQPSDFARLYGLTQQQYKALLPYIHISDDFRPASELVGERETYVRDTLKYPIKINEGEHVNLNIADTMMLRKVPGIGSSWARAIVNYRQRLGGFYSVEQLKELEDFPEDAIAYFTVDVATIQKININQLTLNQLRRHPYINFYQARAICDYRRLNGPLKSLQQLRLNKDFSPEAIRRLEPYVAY